MPRPSNSQWNNKPLASYRARAQAWRKKQYNDAVLDMPIPDCGCGPLEWIGGWRWGTLGYGPKDGEKPRDDNYRYCKHQVAKVARTKVPKPLHLLTPDGQREAIAMARRGHTAPFICTFLGYSTGDLRKTLEENPTFRSEWENAVKYANAFLLNVIEQAREREIPEAAMWLLERTQPEAFRAAFPRRKASVRTGHKPRIADEFAELNALADMLTSWQEQNP